VKGRNKQSEKTLHNRQIIGKRRCCPERQTLLCSVCRHTLVRVSGARASDAGMWPRQTSCMALLPRLSCVAARAISAQQQACVRCVPRSSTRRVYRLGSCFELSGLRPSRQLTCGLRALDASDGGKVASVGRDRRVCRVGVNCSEFKWSRHVVTSYGVRRACRLRGESNGSFEWATSINTCWPAQGSSLALFDVLVSTLS
jgi:hypothetical protein